MYLINAFMDFQLGLNLYSEKVMLFDPLSLGDIENIIQSDSYHIYLLCKRKKIHFTSCELDGPDFCKTTLYYIDDNHDKVFLYYRHPSVLIIHSYANGIYQVTFNGEAKELEGFILINLLLYNGEHESFPEPVESRVSDLQVMYIGQSYGRTKIKTIEGRLSNHEKIQQVALEILRNGTNEELLVIGITVASRDFTTAFSRQDNPQRVTVEELLALQKRAKQRLSERQLITVCEAALITYFQPHLNTEYKSTFPSPGFDSYDELFSINFDYCSMTLAVAPIQSRIFSSHVSKPSYTHSMHFPLSSQSDKQNFFDYLFELAHSSKSPTTLPAGKKGKRRK